MRCLYRGPSVRRHYRPSSDSAHVAKKRPLATVPRPYDRSAKGHRPAPSAEKDPFATLRAKARARSKPIDIACTPDPLLTRWHRGSVQRILALMRRNKRLPLHAEGISSPHKG